tara:strand:+ start:64 stop:1050 length:987 start_codon:yes stop_codon:yes gene_type:complete
MNYRKFSDLGWNVSEIGLGCWQLGWGWGEVISNNNVKEILKKTLDKGINFFDTSDTYGDGRSEKFLSEMIKSTSERLYVSTKLGRRVRGTNYAKGYKQEPMEEFVDRSLLNLGVESIDLLQLHCPPSDVILKKETYEMMDKIVKKGKIMHYGVSVWTVSDALEAIKNPSVKSIQLVFNIFRQKPAEVFFNEAKKKNVAVIARGPLASGLLTGKINKKTKFAENDHRNYNINGKAFDIGDTFSGVNLNTGLEAVEELKNLVPKNHTLTTLALKWILSHEAVSVVIPGAANKLQAEMNASTSELEDISDIIPKINAIYERFIKPDYHDRW